MEPILNLAFDSENSVFSNEKFTTVKIYYQLYALSMMKKQ